jgi:hypothetical protein
MIELPVIGDDAIEVDMLVSPVFCRLKRSVGSLRLTNRSNPVTLNWHQIYIVVWSKEGEFYIYQNGLSYPLPDHQDYFEFYDSVRKAWCNEGDTVVIKED